MYMYILNINLKRYVINSHIYFTFNTSTYGAPDSCNLRSCCYGRATESMSGAA